MDRPGSRFMDPALSIYDSAPRLPVQAADTVSGLPDPGIGSLEEVHGVAAGVVLVVLAALLVRRRVRRRRERRRGEPAARVPGGGPAPSAGPVLLIPEPEAPPTATGTPGRVLGLDPVADGPPRRPGRRLVVVVVLAGVTAAVAPLFRPGSPTRRDPGAPVGVASADGARPAAGRETGEERGAGRVEPGTQAAEPDVGVGAADAGVGGVEAGAGGTEGRVSAVDPATGRRLILWAGDGQTGRPERPLGRALAVVLRDADGRPVPGVEIRFAAASGGGRVEPGASRTSDLGLATAVWWPGRIRDSLRVTAYAVDAPDQRVVFRATVTGAIEGPLAAGSPGGGVAEDPEDPESAGTGADDEGAAGTRPEAPPPLPRAPIRATLKPRALLSAGGVHTCRILDPGGVSCWGAGESVSGRPGARRAVVVGGIPQGAPDLRTVSAGVFHSCGLTADGAVYCWAAQPGAAIPDSIPDVRIELPDRAVPVDVVAGAEHSCALAASGRVYCWGANTHGQLGDGSTRDARTPVRVQGLTSAVQIAAGWLHTCALTAEGEAYCWGANAAGQLGDGGQADHAVPTPVRHGGAFTEIRAGSAHTCALTDAGAAWCWGSNQHGQLGTGTRANALRPVPVQGAVSFRMVTAGGVHTCGLDEDGAAWCWGRNTFGQLGVGGGENALVPTRVSGGLRFVTLDAGGAHTCGEARDGALWCWGNNVQGQIGDGSRANRMVPVRVEPGS